MANPSFVAIGPGAFQAQGTQSFAVAVQLTVTAATGFQAQFSIELPMTVSAISVTGGSAHSVTTSGPSTFSDTDTSGTTAQASVSVSASTPQAGTQTLTFNVTVAADAQLWWVIAASNGAQQATFTVVDQGSTAFGWLLGAPVVAAPVPDAPPPGGHGIFQWNQTVNLTGTVQPSSFLVPGAPTGTPPLPDLLGVWQQTSPSTAQSGLAMSPVQPDPATHVVNAPPIVVPQNQPTITYTFSLVGSYGTPASPIVTSAASIAVKFVMPPSANPA